MTDQLVTLSTDGRVARLALDRGEFGNLITSTMMRQLADALGAAGGSGADILVISSTSAMASWSEWGLCELFLAP